MLRVTGPNKTLSNNWYWVQERPILYLSDVGFPAGQVEDKWLYIKSGGVVVLL